MHDWQRSQAPLARPCSADRGLLCRGSIGRAGNISEHPQLVRRAGKAIPDATRLAFWASVVRSLPEHGGGGVAGMAAGKCPCAADDLRRPVDLQRSLVMALLLAAQPRCRIG
jgi:hypothetical protein